LPDPVKRPLHRIASRGPPAFEAGFSRARGRKAAGPTRSFTLRLPEPPPDVDRAISRTHPSSLAIEAPAHLFVPQQLDAEGLAGYYRTTLATFLAAADLTDGAIFDVGANVGIFALLAAALTPRPVVAFEPTPELAFVLRWTAAANSLQLMTQEIALGAEDGYATLYLSPTDTSNSLRAGFRRRARGSVEVRVRRLDSYCRGSLFPALMKIDTESTEPDVLRGAGAILSKRRPWLICEVLAGRTEEALEQVLRPLGYTWYRIGEETPFPVHDRIVGDPVYEETDWLFTPEPAPPLLWRRIDAWQAALRACGPTRELPIA
jgi:FkbM family methyltransferase